MADNKLLLKRDSDEDFLAEDDPLAELARLVGFDPAPAVSAAPIAQRREPAFDLEDELLKELEIYQQPIEAASATVAPAYDSVAEPEPQLSWAAVAPEPAIAADRVAEPLFDLAPEVLPQPEPEPVRPPVILEAVETLSDASGQHIYERPASHPVFDLEDEILREFSAFDARRVTHADEHPVVAELIHQDPPAEEAKPEFVPDVVSETVPVELHDAPDIRSSFAPLGHGRHVYESFRGDDLDEAISNASVTEVPGEAAEPLAEPVLHDDADPEAVSTDVNAFSVAALEPLDESFWSSPVADIAEDSRPIAVAASHGDDVAELAVSEPAFVEPPTEDFVEQDDELVSQDFADVIPMAPVVVAEPVVLAPAPVYSEVPREAASAQDYGLDELLAEVEKYPVADNTARWGVQSKPIAAEDVVRAAPPVVQDFVASQPVAAAFEPRPIVDEAPIPEFAAAPVESLAEPVIDESSFDIDLGDIELDLSDLNEGSVSASPDLLGELADEPVAVPDEPAVLVPVRTVDTDYSSLPFDPSQITQEDETFEAIAEMDVPDAPVVHEEEKPAPHPEYDIDLDAEMAQLFVTATAQSATSQRTTDGPIAVDGATQRAPSGALDLDDFERALEEDFRRSFAENRAGTPDRVSLAPVHAEATPAKGGRSWIVMAGAATIIVLFGGAGVYAFMTGNTRILNPTDPKIILADTDPVKIVPDDPGGKLVPNQNKAVYDRVAGEKVDGTKQESLVTSDEVPIDVVQRTLMPETLQMDDDTMSVTTPTGDTVDPRLLPDEEEQDRVTTTNKVVSGVSPRKVKTMVVRPDGTLVEREVTDEDLKQQATNDAELMKIAQKAAQDAATASDSQADDIAKAIENVPERLAADDATAVKADEIKADEVKVDTTADVAADATPVKVPPVEPVTIDDAADAVVEKPTDTAVTDVTTTDSKPAADLTEAKPVEVASETKPVDIAEEKPVERSIAVDETAADAAKKIPDVAVAEEEPGDAPVRKVKTTKITPVPEIRPVEQPVDIVATIDDTGKVRSDTEAKSEVAAVDEAAQKPVETAVVPTGSYVIQIASLPSEAEAQTSYTRLSAKFSGIIGGKGVDIRRAEIKNKGTYYRVRIPVGSKQEAQALCSQYKAAGGSCLVSK
jgi:hypothetical protein